MSDIIVPPPARLPPLVVSVQAGATVQTVAGRGPKGEDGAPGSVWAGIAGKPATFPPSAHGHAIADITGLQTALSTTSGWGAYFNTAAAQTLVANTKVTLTNNAATVIETQKPADIATFYNGAVIPGRDGDGVAIGIEFTLTPSSALASIMSVSIDIGGAVGELYLHEYPVLRGSGVPQKISYNIAAYMLNTWQANGGLVKVLCDGPGSVTAVRYVIQRLHKVLT